MDVRFNYGLFGSRFPTRIITRGNSAEIKVFVYLFDKMTLAKLAGAGGLDVTLTLPLSYTCN